MAVWGHAVHVKQRAKEADLELDSFDNDGRDLSIASDDMPSPTRVRSTWKAFKVVHETLADGKDPLRQPIHWDKGLCCGLQTFCIALILMVVFTAGAVAAALGDSYMYLQWVYDWKWGFALQEGYPYTAPVW